MLTLVLVLGIINLIIGAIGLFYQHRRTKQGETLIKLKEQQLNG